MNSFIENPERMPVNSLSTVPFSVAFREKPEEISLALILTEQETQENTVHTASARQSTAVICFFMAFISFLCVLLGGFIYYRRRTGAKGFTFSEIFFGFFKVPPPFSAGGLFLDKSEAAASLCRCTAS